MNENEIQIHVGPIKLFLIQKYCDDIFSVIFYDSHCFCKNIPQLSGVLNDPFFSYTAQGIECL